MFIVASATGTIEEAKATEVNLSYKRHVSGAPPSCVMARCVGLGTASVGAASVLAVRVATWNVNSVKQRVPRLLPWLDQRQPDVVCLQETKLADDAFRGLLGDELDRRGYESRCTARRNGTG